jgi:hypothetical protein
MIEIEAIDDRTFTVTVTGARRTTHQVTVDPADYQRLTQGRVSPATLVERSFEFLLERESNTSILRRFDLSVISRYFPEYESILPQMLA